MGIFSNVTKGFVSVVTVTSTPMLYRYPYRTSAEGLRADFLHVSEDIYTAIGKLDRWQKQPPGEYESDDDYRI